MILRLSSLAACVALTACAAPAVTPDAPDAVAPSNLETSEVQATVGTVTFRDRTIDLEPYVQGFPYGISGIDLEHDLSLTRWSTPDGIWLLESPISTEQPLDVTAGRRLVDVDWSTRSFWGAVYREADDAWYAWADEQNEERMNIYRIDRQSGAMTPATDNDYTYGWGFSEDEQYLAFISRTGDGEPFNSCLHVRDMSTGDEVQLWCDGGGADRLTWTGVDFAPDNGSLVVVMQHDGDRNRTSLARFDAGTPGEPALLLDRDVERFGVYTVGHWTDPTAMLYVSSESGFDEVYRLDLATGESAQLTNLGREISSIDRIEFDGHDVVVATLKWPHQTELVALDAQTGEALLREAIPATVSISDAWGDTIAADIDAVDVRFALDRIQLVEGEDGALALTRTPWAVMPAALAASVVQCRASAVEIPTFDTTADGQQRVLHAFYLEPITPPAHDEDRMVIITSFYGGENYYSTTEHILCAAGIATLSPAPRGSSGFGAEFAALNDGDLGGDEIIDLMYAARWLETEHGYQHHQIGVRGGSHGGYATMRALTFPPETNDRGESYPFGFGLSHAGFSNILTFYASCNIPDWVILEAGDPATDSARLLDRSPIAHVDLLSAPLLLTHGSNDQRVPVEESRTFAEAAATLHAPVTYVEFDGQGHGISGLDNTVRYFGTVFAFLQSVVDGW